MTGLLVTLFIIALLDSTSMLPIAVVPLAAILGSAGASSRTIGFLGGIFLVYVIAGLLLMFGLDAAIDVLRVHVYRWWNQPNTPELVLQLLIGMAMLVAAWKKHHSPSRETDTKASSALSMPGAFTLGFGLTIVGLPGAVPYFGAIDQILRADLSSFASVAAIVFYCIAFLTPLLLLVLARALFPRHSEKIFQSTTSMLERWGKHLTVGALIILGVIFIADGIGWFLGYPLLPTESS